MLHSFAKLCSCLQHLFTFSHIAIFVYGLCIKSYVSISKAISLFFFLEKLKNLFACEALKQKKRDW